MGQQELPTKGETHKAVVLHRLIQVRENPRRHHGHATVVADCDVAGTCEVFCRPNVADLQVLQDLICQS